MRLLHCISMQQRCAARPPSFPQSRGRSLARSPDAVLQRLSARAPSQALLIMHKTHESALCRIRRSRRLVASSALMLAAVSVGSNDGRAGRCFFREVATIKSNSCFVDQISRGYFHLGISLRLHELLANTVFIVYLIKLLSTALVSDDPGSSL